jgi:RNA polymerase-binding transcription factor DksA
MTRRTREAMDKPDAEIVGLQEQLDDLRRTSMAANARGNAHREFVDLVEQMQQADPDNENRKALRARISQELRRANRRSTFGICRADDKYIAEARR